MRDFLIQQTNKFGNFKRPGRSFGLLILLFISLLLNSFNKIYAYSELVQRVDNVTAYAKNEDTVRPVSGVLPGNVSNDEIRKRALAKIREFQGCLFILCDITSGYTALDNAVDQATGLFVEGAIIEVSSVHHSEKKQLKVRDFLEKFSNLHYERVVITFSHVDYVSNIRKGVDGKYYGLVSFEQTFRGYNDGRLVYEDETKKTTEVQLVVYERNLHGNAIQTWDVLLSDVEILGTKTPKR